jgi:4-nitrophenyl phosphatase
MLAIKSFTTYLLDCDGVLYSGEKPIHDSGFVIDSLLRTNKQVIFVTNSSGSSRKQMKLNLERLLNVRLDINSMFPSCYACAMHIKKNNVKTCYVVGNKGLFEELEEVGIVCFGENANKGPPFNVTKFANSKTVSRVDAIVCGLTTEFNYNQLCEVCLYLQENPDAVFISTNNDSYDMINGKRQPANGCLVAAIEYCSGRKSICMGKPTAILGDILMSQYTLDKTKTIMVGDRLDTDIQFGKMLGVKTALVLTGCSRESDVSLCEIKPDFIIPDINALISEHRSRL